MASVLAIRFSISAIVAWARLPFYGPTLVLRQNLVGKLNPKVRKNIKLFGTKETKTIVKRRKRLFSYYFYLTRV